jgi:tyrosine-protein phosphatase SIW14
VLYIEWYIKIGKETLSEMLNDGYGYHSMWKDIVAFIKEVNVEQLKKDSQINK